MSYEIIPREDERWAVWSTVVDDFVLDEAARDEVRAFFLAKVTEQTLRRVAEAFWYRLDGAKRHQMQHTYAEACELRDTVHGRPT